MKLEVYIVHNGYISHIVSCNSSQNFEFVKLVILSNSYASQIWKKPYFHHNIRKYEVTSLMVMQKYIFVFSTWMEENKPYVQVPRNRN